MEGQKNFPQIAFGTYLKLKEYPQFLRFTQAIITTLGKMIRPIERARFVHEMVEHEMSELGKNPAVKKYLACEKGCSACCHTQVSVTSDEADLLAKRVVDGAAINWVNLYEQRKAGNEFNDYMKMSYQTRRCVFLKDDQTCSVYEDRPSVCRTNAVVGDAKQCDTKDGNMQSQQILNTYHADMIIMGAYMSAEESGVLPFMLWKKLHQHTDTELIALEKKVPGTVLKEVFNTKSLG